MAVRDHKLWNTGKLFSFLGKEEERELALLAGNGDREATDRLITSHFNYVVKLAKGYRRSGVPMSDLIQEGMVGLVQAVKRFNPDKSVRLSTYAMWWIRASMQDHIVRSWSLVRLSTTSAQKSLYLNLRRLTGDLINGADALSDEIVARLAERFETTASDVRNLARRIASKDQSLDAQISERGKSVWLDVLVSDEPNAEEVLTAKGERMQLYNIIAKALSNLSDREQFIIRHRYFTEAKRTFASIGQELDLSKDRVRQLEACALKTLQELLGPVLDQNQLFIK
ncbi:MAG TPA: sigma-70 family RNA polymerase sigma factor [Rhodospirillales bacterium]|nr:sigma-70 family RNA polymerase sigma factor [Rhodospirillales bacterium]HIL75681.1 sigma-70 family RNA polymerase sigma factor [Rhodospirillales bacterium]